MNECCRADGNLVTGGRDPWIAPDEASVDEIKDVVERCPSGALTAIGPAGEAAPAKNTINVSYHGPLFVHGDLEIVGAPETPSGTKFRAALCRCGQSKNKPFCDNSHIAAKFSDSGAVVRTGDAQIAAGGPLKVTPMKDASLIVTGNLARIASGGREVWSGTRASLCRCGASKTKPFCDGGHKKIGFKAD